MNLTRFVCVLKPAFQSSILKVQPIFFTNFYFHEKKEERLTTALPITNLNVVFIRNIHFHCTLKPAFQFGINYFQQRVPGNAKKKKKR